MPVDDIWNFFFFFFFLVFFLNFSQKIDFDILYRLFPKGIKLNLHDRNRALN